VLFVAHVAVQTYRGELSDFERTPPAQITRHPQQTGIAGLEETSFPGEAGLQLAAWYAPPRNRAAVVLVHGTNSDRSSLLPEARLLAAAGFGVLALDMPGQGMSAGQTRWAQGEVRAISAAVDWLSARAEVDSGRIGAFGLSYGGYMLLQAAAHDARLRAVVLASTPYDLDDQAWRANARWGVLSSLPAVWLMHRFRGAVNDLAPLEAIRALSPRAVFVLCGERDSTVPGAACERLFAAAGPPKELWIMPRAGHADFSDVAPGEYARRLTGFFQRELLLP